MQNRTDVVDDGVIEDGNNNVQSAKRMRCGQSVEGGIQDATFDTDDDDTNSRIIYRFHDRLGNDHWVVRYPKRVGRTGKRYTMARRCTTCKKHTCCYCLQCNTPLCYCIKNEGKDSAHDRQCFKKYIQEHVRRTDRLDSNELVSELVV